MSHAHINKIFKNDQRQPEVKLQSNLNQFEFEFLSSVFSFPKLKCKSFLYKSEIWKNL